MRKISEIIKLLQEDRIIYETAIRQYGNYTQFLVAIEEMSELQKELCKEMRGLANIEHISEEMADTIIMIYQLFLIYGNEKEVARFIDEKGKSLANRIIDG